MAAKKKPVDPIAKRVRALRAFRASEHFDEVMALLKENAAWGQSPFGAANWDTHKAAGIDGRQGLVRIFEDEIRKAERYTEPTDKAA